MLEQIKRYLAPPVFDEDDKTQSARTLYLILLASLVASPLIAANSLLIHQFYPLPPLSVFFMFALFSLWLVRRGQCTVPSYLIPLATLGALSYILYVGNGIHDTAVTFFTLLIVFAALLLGKRGTIIFGLLSMVSLTWIVHAEVRGVIVTGFGQVTGYSDIVTIGVMLGVTILMLWVTLDSSNKSLTSARCAEAEARESEQRYRTLINALPEGVAISDMSGNINFASSQLLSMYASTTLEEALGTNALQWIAPESHEKARANLQRLSRNEISTDNEYVLLKRGGTRFWGEINGAVLADDQGNPRGLVTVHRDITERKRAEQVQAAVYRISEAAQTVPNLDELFASIHAVISELMPARNYYIAVYDASADLFHFPYHADEVDNEWPPMRPGKNLTGYVFRTGKPLLATPLVFEQMVQSGQVELIGAPSLDWLGVPLKTQHGETFGVMVVQTYAEDVRLREADQAVLVFVSTQVAMAIERKRAEEALRESEERYRSFVQNFQGIAFRRRPDFTPIFFHGAVEKITGYTEDEFLAGKPKWDQIIHPPDLERIYASVEKVRLVAGYSTEREYRIVRRDGQLRWIHELTQNLQDSCGQPAGVQGALYDISERKQAEEQIYKLNRTLQVINGVNQSLMRAADETELLQHVCRIIVDLGGYRMTWVGLAEQDTARMVRPVAAAGHEDGYLTAVNFTWADDERGSGPAGTAIRTVQPFIARNIPTDPHLAPWREQAAHRGYMSSIALPLLSSGQAFGALNIYAVETDAFDEEEVKLLTEMADDLSYGIVALRTRAERQQAEEQIQRLNLDLERRARGLAALNQAGQIMASTLDLNTLLERVMQQVSRLLDAEGTSVLLHPTASEGDATELVFAAATGAASARLLGKRLPGDTGIAGWVTREKQPALVADAQSDPRFDHRVDTDTGLTTRCILAMPLISKGEALGVIEAVNKLPAGGHGVFDQHDVEMLMALTSSAAIAIENARLYATERERVAALARALEQQRALDRLQRQFIQNVSHELRTPLAIVRGHAELLETGWFGPLQPEQRESLSIILRRTQMLTRMVDDIVSILEMERRELKREQIDMAQLVRTSVADFQATAQKGDLALIAEIAPNLQPISGDSMAWRRVLDNLVGNACKFTPASGRVTVRLWQDVEGTHLQVTDTGIGIAPEHLGRIFERFYQVDGSSTRRYGGIGLGLALVKEIVEAHGGQVTAESQVGAGTTFAILLAH